MTIELRSAHNDDTKEWDVIIASSPHGTLFHQWDWLKIVEKHTKMKLYPLIGMKNGVSVGLFPVYFQKMGPIRMVFSPPPHADLFYLGPVIIGYETFKQETKETIYSEFIKSVENFFKNVLKANYISISLSPSLQDPRPFIWSGYSNELNFDYIINISHGCDYLLQTLDKRGRQNLNRAKKRGFMVEIGGKREFEKILDLMEIRYIEQGKNITASRHYFLDIYDAYKDTLKIFIAKVDGEVVTGNIDFEYKNTHYSWIGNPKPKNRISPSPNDLLIWESIRYAYEQGLMYYVTMNAAGNNRLHSYYSSKFDPELKIHYSVKKTTFITGLLEKGYSNLLKPMSGMLKQQMQVD